MCLSDTWALSLSHTSSDFSRPPRIMWGLANERRNILTCEPQITRSESGAEGPGLGAVTPGNHGVWQPHWGLRSAAFWERPRAAFQPRVLPEHFLHKPSLTSVCQTNVAKEPEDLRVH